MSNFTDYFGTRGYSLHLSDGNNWWITSDDKSIDRLDEFVAITQLEEGSFNGSPKLIFAEDIELNHNLGTDIKWKALEYSSIFIWHNFRSEDIICDFRDANNSKFAKYNFMQYSLYPIFQRSMKVGGLPFHAGLAEYSGKGVLFCAEGGVGKSTCCSRLPNHWKALCDDEALVAKRTDKEYLVHPFPTWSEYILGKSKGTWGIQHSVPLSAIFFLEQSDGDEVIPLNLHESIMLITDSARQSLKKFFPPKYKMDEIRVLRIAFNNAVDIAKQIPAYRLRVSLTGRFWEEIEKVI